MSATFSSLKQAYEAAQAIRSFVKLYRIGATPGRKETVVIEDERVIFRGELDRGDHINYETAIAYWSGKAYKRVEKTEIRKYKTVEGAIKHINDMITYTDGFNASNRLRDPQRYTPWAGCACNVCVSYRLDHKMPTAV